ncbi:MAG: hypothetical protein FWF82_04460 [Oscillospiraceae bacterium]|nr:hypothetical protein [Oscillospiraceae bacterium]
MAIVMALGVIPATVIFAAETESEPVSFTVVNPYEQVDWDSWGQYKASLHAHSTLSDGSSTISDMAERHYALGYNIVALTEHNILIPSADKSEQYALAENKNPRKAITLERVLEMAQNLNRSADNGMIFMEGTTEQSTVSMSDFPKTGSPNASSWFHLNSYWSSQQPWNYKHVYSLSPDGTEEVSALAKRLTDGDNGESQLWFNHVARNTGGRYANGSAITTHETAAELANRPAVYKKLAEYFNNYSIIKGMEIINELDNESQADRILWDNILTQTMPERPVWGSATDDSHHVNGVGFSYNLMLMPELSLDNVKVSMDSGAFFAFTRVDRTYGIYAKGLAPTLTNGGNSSNRAQVLALPTPEVNSISVSDSKITIDADNYEFINWYSDAKLIHTGETLDLNALSDKIGGYIRASVGHSDYGVLYTQPFGIESDREKVVEPEPEEVVTAVLYDMQKDSNLANFKSSSVPFLTRVVGVGTAITVNTSSNPKTISVTGRTGTSQGVRVNVADVYKKARPGYSYKIEYTGKFPDTVNADAVARIRRETAVTLSLATSKAVNGEFSVSLVRTYEEIAADKDTFYSLGNETGNININYTGIVISEISYQTPVVTTTVATTTTVPTTTTTREISTIPTTTKATTTVQTTTTTKATTTVPTTTTSANAVVVNPFTITLNAGEFGPASWDTTLKGSVTANKDGEYSVTVSGGKAERYRDLIISGTSIPAGVTVTIDSVKLNSTVIGHKLANPKMTSSASSIALWSAWSSNKNLTGITVFDGEHIALAGNPVIQTLTVNFTVSGIGGGSNPPATTAATTAQTVTTVATTTTTKTPVTAVTTTTTKAPVTTVATTTTKAPVTTAVTTTTKAPVTAVTTPAATTAAPKSVVIYDMQSDSKLANFKTASTANLTRTIGSGTVITVNTASNPKTITVTGRTGTSQGVRLNLASFSIKSDKTYKIEYSGKFPNNPKAEARIRGEYGTQPVLATALSDANGVFTLTLTRTGSQILADIASGGLYSLGNSSGNIDIVYTGIVVTEY